jgi:4-azaleucine resistance transporter AzlC
MSSSTAPPFTWAGFRAGAIRGLVLVPSIGLYGVAFGIMAGAAGLSTAESMLFSGVVFAGGAQMASLEAWTEPVTFIAVTLTTLAMNARYMLLGATLRPWYRGLPAYQAYLSMFALGDGNWALQMREYEAGRRDAAFLIGSAFFIWFLWVGSTAAGHVFGQLLGDPHRYGADFMLAAFFAAMAVVFFRRSSQLWPLATGVIVAIVVEKLLDGPWYILIGALAGSLVGAFRNADPA